MERGEKENPQTKQAECGLEENKRKDSLNINVQPRSQGPILLGHHGALSRQRGRVGEALGTRLVNIILAIII